MPRTARRGATTVKTALRDESGVIRVRLGTGPNWTGWLSLVVAAAGFLVQMFGR